MEKEKKKEKKKKENEAGNSTIAVAVYRLLCYATLRYSCQVGSGKLGTEG